MGDLVLLRDLTKSSARGQIIDLNVLFRHPNFDPLFECAMARATSPCSAESLASAFHFLGLRSAVACANTSSGVSGFPRWYSRRLHRSLQLDTMPAALDVSRSKMGNVFALDQTPTRPGASPSWVGPFAKPPDLPRLRSGAGSGDSPPFAGPPGMLPQVTRQERVYVNHDRHASQ